MDQEQHTHLWEARIALTVQLGESGTCLQMLLLKLRQSIWFHQTVPLGENLFSGTVTHYHGNLVYDDEAQ